jgi:hypothetical protein
VREMSEIKESKFKSKTICRCSYPRATGAVPPTDEKKRIADGKAANHKEKREGRLFVPMRVYKAELPSHGAYTQANALRLTA